MNMDQPISSLNLPKSIIINLENRGFLYCKDVEDNFRGPNFEISNWPNVKKAPEPKTAFELLEQESNWKPVTTFVPELDEILKNNITVGCITEFCGLPGSGRTQTCFHLAVGVNGEVVFINTNRNFSSERIKEIAEKYTSNTEAIMERIFCIEATNCTELLACVQFLQSWLDNTTIRLLIIDSISYPLKQEAHSETASFVFRLFQDLRFLAHVHKFSIVVTNNLTTRSAGDQVYTTSSFGDSFYHIINNRILLSKENNLFKAKVLKSVSSGSQDPVTFSEIY